MKRLRKIISDITIDGEGPFDVYALDNFDFCENLQFDEKQGIYAFCNYYRRSDGMYVFDFFYLGKTTDYDTRFYHHHKEKPLKAENPNCVLIYACDKKTMDKQEVKWIELWKPNYNIQHNS